jgi:hypothetical protein
LQARRQVPEAILKQIISLNNPDKELYDHAKNIFTQEHLMLKGQQSMVVQHKQLGDQKVTQDPVVVQDKQLAAQKVWSSS